MVGSMNRATLIGCIGRDPEIKNLNSGERMAMFSLATHEKWKDKATSENKERSDWHQIVVFNEHLVSLIERFCRKGTRVLIEGNLQTREFISKEGIKQAVVNIVLQKHRGTLILMDPKEKETACQAPMKRQEYTQPHQKEFAPRTFDDEIPF